MTKLPVFFGVLYAYIYEYEYIVRMCTNVFLSMPGTILIFLLPYFFSLMDFLFLTVLHFKLSIIDAQFMIALQKHREKVFFKSLRPSAPPPFFFITTTHPD